MGEGAVSARGPWKLSIEAPPPRASMPSGGPRPLGLLPKRMCHSGLAPGLQMSTSVPKTPTSASRTGPARTRTAPLSASARRGLRRPRTGRAARVRVLQAPVAEGGREGKGRAGRLIWRCGGDSSACPQSCPTTRRSATSTLTTPSSATASSPPTSRARSAAVLLAPAGGTTAKSTLARYSIRVSRARWAQSRTLCICCPLLAGNANCGPGLQKRTSVCNLCGILVR